MDRQNNDERDQTKLPKHKTNATKCHETTLVCNGTFNGRVFGTTIDLPPPSAGTHYALVLHVEMKPCTGVKAVHGRGTTYFIVYRVSNTGSSGLQLKTDYCFRNNVHAAHRTEIIFTEH